MHWKHSSACWYPFYFIQLSLNLSIFKYQTTLHCQHSSACLYEYLFYFLSLCFLSKCAITLLHLQHSSACWCTSPGSQADSDQPCQKKYFQSKSVKNVLTIKERRPRCEAWKSCHQGSHSSLCPPPRSTE